MPAAWWAGAQAESADLVTEGVNGLLVDPDDAGELRDALVAVLGDPDAAKRLGRAARHTGEEWSVTPEQYAGRVESLVRHVLGGDSQGL